MTLVLVKEENISKIIDGTFALVEISRPEHLMKLQLKSREWEIEIPPEWKLGLAKAVIPTCLKSSRTL